MKTPKNMQRVRIEMIVPIDMDPSTVLEHMQSFAELWLEEHGRDHGRDHNKLVEDAQNEVSVEVLP